MAKKAKKKNPKKRKVKRKDADRRSAAATFWFGAKPKPPRAAAEQLNNIHNQALKNQQRDQAELQRLQTAEREKMKGEKLELEKEVLERRLLQLNPFGGGG